EEAERQAKGEELTSVDAIYGVDEYALRPEDFFDPEADDIDDRRCCRQQQRLLRRNETMRAIEYEIRNPSELRHAEEAVRMADL
ncbi:hypothetical protein ACCS72_38110, partial [Rhizobium ruizarguesonis]